MNHYLLSKFTWAYMALILIGFSKALESVNVTMNATDPFTNSSRTFLLNMPTLITGKVPAVIILHGANMKAAEMKNYVKAEDFG